MNRGARILLLGGEPEARDEAAALVAQAGFEAIRSGEGGPVSLAPGAAPGLVMLVGPDAGGRCQDARQRPDLADVPVVVLAGAGRDEPAALARTLAAGADEVISGSSPVELVRARLLRLVAGAEEQRRAAALARAQDAMREVQAVTSDQGNSAGSLREILVIATRMLGFERGSLIAHVEGSPSAHVIAATDDPSLMQLAISVDAYPEIAAALTRKEPILIDDARSHALTAPVGDALAEVRGVAVFPLVWRGRAVGVVLLRNRAPGVGHLTGPYLGFADMFSAHTAACLQHSRVLSSLRERTTHRLSRSRYEAERHLRTIDSLREHFEAAADGVLVLNEHGTILFVNRAAESIIGFACSGLIGSNVSTLVAEPEAGAVRRVIERVLGGQNLDAFDLNLVTTSGETLCASVTTSTVLGQNGAAVLSFRDVTAQRALERELRQTKEFLEKLVDSTVDAIVAADMRGNVIIFNQGAERIYGYSAAEVIGRIPVWKLYDEGVPRQVMRMLRSTQYGGVGRLEQTRREILSKSGELVPVTMTASVIYQDGREVATVGIFSDLRERIRIEQRLLQAQEKLQLTEMQAVVAELAGTAAHELNQPLTSIMGYAQLIQRQSGPDAAHQRAVEIILREAERMADIVKQIGRITRYETKEYVGSARMLDLDRAARTPTGDRFDSGPVRAPFLERPFPDEDMENDFDGEDTTQVQVPDLARRTGAALDDLAEDDDPDFDDEQRIP